MLISFALLINCCNACVLVEYQNIQYVYFSCLLLQFGNLFEQWWNAVDCVMTIMGDSWNENLKKIRKKDNEDEKQEEKEEWEKEDIIKA